MENGKIYKCGRCIDVNGLGKKLGGDIFLDLEKIAIGYK